MLYRLVYGVVRTHAETNFIANNRYHSAPVSAAYHIM